MIDMRQFLVVLSGERLPRMRARVAAARAEATRLVRQGTSGVRLVNPNTGASFRWWPELGTRVAP